MQATSGNGCRQCCLLLPQRHAFTCLPGCSAYSLSTQTCMSVLYHALQDGSSGSSTSSSSSGSRNSSQESSSSGSHTHRQQQQQQWSREALAAMALSPFAALSLPLAQDPAWRESAAGFGERLRAQLQDTVFSDGFQHKWQQVSNVFMSVSWGARWSMAEAGMQAGRIVSRISLPSRPQDPASCWLYIPNPTQQQRTHTHPQSCALTNSQPPVLVLHCCSSRMGSPTWSGPTP